MTEVASGDREQLSRHAETLRDDYGGTAYAPLAALAAARAAVDAGAPGEAEPWLRWAMENADQAQIAHLARVRLARVVAAGGDADAALELLDAEVPNEYTALYAEIRGDVLAGQGEAAAAASAYQQALDAEVPPADPGLVRRKLNRVSPAEADPAQAGDEAASS